MDGIFYVKTVESCTLCKNAFADAMTDGFKEFESTGKNYGGNSIINTSVQLTIYPQRTASGEIGQIVFFGTLVKYKK